MISACDLSGNLTTLVCSQVSIAMAVIWILCDILSRGSLYTSPPRLDGSSLSRSGLSYTLSGSFYRVVLSRANDLCKMCGFLGIFYLYQMQLEIDFSKRGNPSFPLLLWAICCRRKYFSTCTHLLGRCGSW